MNFEFSKNEKRILWLVAAIGFVILNSVFLWVAWNNPAQIIDALKNPISLVFIIEAFIMMGVLAFVIAKSKVSRLHWRWFIIFSLLGSMAFAYPIMLLFPEKSIKK